MYEMGKRREACLCIFCSPCWCVNIMRIGRSVNVLGGAACLSDDRGVRAPLHALQKPLKETCETLLLKGGEMEEKIFIEYIATHKGDGIWEIFYGQESLGLFHGCFDIFHFLSEKHPDGLWSVQYYKTERSQMEEIAINPFKSNGISVAAQIYRNTELLYREED